MTVNSKPIKPSFAIEGNKIFNDVSLKIDHISDNLLQFVGHETSTFYKLSWKDTNQTSISVSCDKECVVITVLWEDETLQDSLRFDLLNQGWISKSEESMHWWKGYGEDVPRVMYNYGYSKAVLSKKNPAGHTISINRPENDSPLSIIVGKGKTYTFFASKLLLIK